MIRLMKKMILSIALTFTVFSNIFAMSYEEARRQALFLTDKMAYELNLNDQQYEDCYEINLDYLLSVETADDAYGNYLAYRNADLRHILLDWQYTIFAAADYFLHPLYWHRGVWHYPIYRYYAVNRFFYGRPHVYFSYRGGHGRFHYSAGYYGSRRPHSWTGGLRGMDRGAVGHHGGGYHVGGGRRSGGDYHIGEGRRSGGGYHIGEGRQGGGGHRLESGRSSQGYTHPSSTRSTVYNGGDTGYRSSEMGRSAAGAGRSHSMGSGYGQSRSHSMSSGANVSRSHSMGSGTRSGSIGGGMTRGGGFSGGARGGGSPQSHSGHSSRGGR